MSEYDSTRVRAPSEDPAELEREVVRALSLVLPGSKAAAIVRDALSEHDIDDQLDLCRAVAPLAVWQYRWRRWSARLTRRPTEQLEPVPLVPETGIAANNAIALALHLGVGLDRDELSDVLSTSWETVARRLYNARKSLLENPSACEHPPITLLAFYDESTLDLSERMQLREHLRFCQGCSDLTVRFDELDAHLIAQMNSLPLASAPADDSRGFVSLQSAWFPQVVVAGIALILFLGIGGVLIGVDRVLGRSSDPVPLIPEREKSDLEGWLVSSTVDGVAALNLASGEHRTLLQPSIEGSQPPVIMVSPSSTKVALWRFHDDQRITTSVDIVSITGEPIQTWRWDRFTSPGQISSWLGDDHLLFIRPPSQTSEESAEEYAARVSRENQLVSLDVVSGQRDTIFTGSVAAAVPSPDTRHIAILGTYNRFTAQLPGRTLEVRPMVDGLLGEPLLVEEQRLPLQNTRPIWSSDSNRLYFPRLTDDSTGTQSDGRRDERSDIAMATIEGESTIISENPERERIRILGVSPGNDFLLYLKSNPGVGEVTWDLYRVETGTGEQQVLASSIAHPFSFSATAVWLPDGETAIINDSRNHYIHGHTATRTVKAGATRFLSIGEDRPVMSIATELGLWGVDGWGEPTLRWLPEDALEETDASPDRAPLGIFSEPEEVGDSGNLRHTTQFSSISPGGQFALFEHTSIGVPIVWNTTSASGRLLAGTPTPADISWAPGSAALVGVQNDPENGAEITLFASRTTRVADFFDYRGGDPAELNTESSRQYASPSFSADGNHLSYFVTNEQSGHVELWISSFASGHERVLEWQTPEDALIDPPVASVWTSDSTILTAVPDAWDGGYPTQIRLVEVDVDVDGDDWFSARTVHSFGTSANERGVTIQAFEFSPDSEMVAFRLRAYSSREPERGQRDSIVIAAAKDASQSITISRGNPGLGLSWSPDNSWISFGLNERVYVSRFDGTDLRALSEPEQAGRFPLWMPDGDLYYTEGREDDPQLMRVTTR